VSVSASYSGFVEYNIPQDEGNPLFVSRLMLSLSKDGLLRLSLSRGRWEWDEEKILCQNLPDDVAEFLTHSIGKLPEDVKSSLRIFSCFGASLISAFVKSLERALDINLVDSLDVAVAEGLLEKTDDQYRFSHDRIQEAAYNMMNFLDRCENHFTYGMALAPLTVGEEGHSTLLSINYYVATLPKGQKPFKMGARMPLLLISI
jgi:predicted ATPase